MKKKGKEHSYTLEKTGEVGYMYSPQCRKKGFRNFLHLETTSHRLRGFRESRLVKNGDKVDLTEEDKRFLEILQKVEGKRVEIPFNGGMMRWIRHGFSRFWC